MARWVLTKKEGINASSYSLMLEDTLEGNYVWNVMGSSLLYAADLMPEIANDIVNIDNAMKWEKLCLAKKGLLKS